MIYKAKEFILKDNRRIIVKSPTPEDAFDMLNHIIKVAGSTDFLLSMPEDFQRFVDDITKEEELIKNYAEGPNYLLAAYLDGQIIGNCSLNFCRHVKDQHRAVVGIAIQKEYWGIGVGTVLMGEMINLAKNTEGIEQVELGVISINERAKNLYTKMGFKKVGTIPRQLKLKDGTYLDEDLMILPLSHFVI